MPENNEQNTHPKPEDVYTSEQLFEALEKENGLETLDSEKLRKTPPYVIASFLNRLSADDCRIVLRKIPDLDASAILSEMDADASAEIVAAMREWRALKILEEFDPDDAADVISELDEPDRIRLLSKLPPEKQKALRALLKYGSDTAGGIMTPNFVSVKEDMTVDEVIKYMRKIRDEIDRVTYIYIVDDKRKLKGVLSIRELIIANPHQKIKTIMTTDLKGVCSVNEDKEKVALTMAELNLYDLPVVDEEGRLLGIVEHDDVLDIVQSEATEDLQKMVGAGGDEGIYDSITYSIQRRGPWLIVNLFTAFVAALVISHFQDKIAQLAYLAVFMPVIVSLGGNTGSQALAVAVRSLALGEIKTIDDFRICMKEGLKGILIGLMIGILGGIMSYLISHQAKLSILVFAAIVLNMGIGGTLGALIPITLKRLKLDPAQSSSIFLTGITDACGFLIFLSLGAWLLF